MLCLVNWVAQICSNCVGKAFELRKSVYTYWAMSLINITSTESVGPHFETCCIRNSSKDSGEKVSGNTVSTNPRECLLEVKENYVNA